MRMLHCPALSPDSATIYVKTMFDSVQAYSTTAPDAQLRWETRPGFGYEIAPTPCACSADGRWVFVPTDKGNLFCLNAKDGSLAWIHKISVAMLNSIVPLPDDRLLISTMDGVVTLLQY